MFIMKCYDKLAVKQYTCRVFQSFSSHMWSSQLTWITVYDYQKTLDCCATGMVICIGIAHHVSHITHSRHPGGCAWVKKLIERTTSEPFLRVRTSRTWAKNKVGGMIINSQDPCAPSSSMASVHGVLHLTDDRQNNSRHECAVSIETQIIVTF